MDLVVAHHQIRPFDQEEAEVARHVGVLEMGFAQRSRCQQADPRLDTFGLDREARAEALEEGSKALDVHRAVEIREGTRQGETVLKRVAGTRRSLGAITKHPPSAIDASAQIDRIQRKKAAAGRSNALQRM